MNQNNQQRNDEIDLRELLLTLWQGKWIIASISTILPVVGFVYLYFFQTYTATFDINPVASYEIEKYTELNYLLRQLDIVDLMPEQQTEYTTEKNNSFITSQVLVNLLIERLKYRQDFVEAIKELNLITREDKTDEEWILAINELVYNVQFLQPLSKEEIAKIKTANPRLNWQIKIEGLKEQNQYKQLLELTLKKSNEFVRQEMLNKVQNKINLLEAKHRHEIEDIDIEIKSSREDYKAKLLNRIAYLKEQAQIARHLNIAKSTLDVEYFNSKNGILTTLQTETPFYLRGYDAIEKELTLLENRKTTDEYIPELTELNQKRRVILEDQLKLRLTQALKTSNIEFDKYFSAAKIDIEEIKFEMKFKISISLLLLILIGFLIGVIIIFIRNILFREIKNNNG